MNPLQTIARDVEYAIRESQDHGMIARIVCDPVHFSSFGRECNRRAEAAGMVLRMEHTTPTMVLCSAYYPSRGPLAPEWRVEIEAEGGR